MLDLTSPRGLGDAIHLRALVLHLIGLGEEVTVFTGWPEVFVDLPITVKGVKDRSGQEDIRNCVACMHCRLPEVRGRLTTMFEMACRQSGFFDRIELRADWKVRNHSLIASIRRRAEGKKVFVYQPPRITNGLPEQEVMKPRAEEFNGYLERQSTYYRVKIGHPASAHEFRDAPCELSLFGKTSVQDAFDVLSDADMIFSAPSYLTIFAQAMDRPFACMFTRRAQVSQFSRARNLTPEVLFHKPGLVVYAE